LLVGEYLLYAGTDPGGGHRGCPPLPEMKPSTYSLSKI